jgi:hypothetical protein
MLWHLHYCRRCALGAGATLLSGARTFIVNGLSNTADNSTSVATSLADSTTSLHELLGVLQQQSVAASIEQHHKQAVAAAASAAVALSHEAALTRALDQLNATADYDELTASNSNTTTSAQSVAQSDAAEIRDWRLPRPMQVWYKQQNASDYRSIC